MRRRSTSAGVCPHVRRCMPALATAALALGAASLPSAASAQGNACFRVRDVLNARAPDSRTIYLRVGGGAIWELKLFSACRDAVRGFRVNIQTRGGSQQVCEGNGMNVDIVPSRSASSPSYQPNCKVSGVRQLTSEEANALGGTARP